MPDGYYQLDAGRKVSLHGLHIRLAAQEAYEGRPELIREQVLGQLPRKVAQLFSEHTPFILREEPPCPLPQYLFLADLICYEPIRPKFHFSSLIVGWFADALPTNLDDYVSQQIRSIDWNAHAADGEW